MNLPWAALHPPGPPSSVTPMKSDRGMSAALFRCAWPGANTPTAVLKISTQRARGERELLFLRTATPSADLPRLLGAVEEPDRVLILLEDLGGCDEGDILRGVSGPVALQVMGVLGRLHAVWWNRVPPGWSVAPPRWRETSLVDVDRFIARNPHPWGQARLRDLVAAREGHRAVLAEAPATLSHADAHLDNWMFRGGDPVLIDWETARIGPGIVDAARFLMEGVHTEVRRGLQAELVERWRREVDADAEQVSAWLRAAVWYSLNAMVPHHANIDLQALSPRMRDVHVHCARQVQELAEDLLG